jgi:hypothetical protein
VLDGVACCGLRCLCGWGGALTVTSAYPPSRPCVLLPAGEMIGCDNQHCLLEWFHLGCVGLLTTNRPRGKWCVRGRGWRRDGGGRWRRILWHAAMSNAHLASRTSPSHCSRSRSRPRAHPSSSSSSPRRYCPDCRDYSNTRLIEGDYARIGVQAVTQSTPEWRREWQQRWQETGHRGGILRHCPHRRLALSPTQPHSPLAHDWPSIHLPPQAAC